MSKYSSCPYRDLTWKVVSFQRALLAAVLTLLLIPQDCRAQVTVIQATKLFATTTTQSNGLAYDGAADHLYIAEPATSTAPPKLWVYDLDGFLVIGDIDLPGSGSQRQLGLHVLRAPANVGGETFAAGTLLFLRGGSNLVETTLYALDKSTGLPFASTVLATGLETPTGCEVLNRRGTGLGYATQSNLFLSADPVCGVIGEVSDGMVTGFFERGVSGSQSVGDVKEHPLTGHLWVGGPAPGADNPVQLTEHADSGVLLQEFEVIDEQNPEQAVVIARIAFDTDGQRLWLLTTDGDVYQVSGSVTAVDLSGGHDDLARPRVPFNLKAVPNPFNPRTRIQFELASAGTVQLEIFDLRGRPVWSQPARHHAAGLHTVEWNGSSLAGNTVPSGTYFVRISGDHQQEMGKIALLR